MVGGFSSGGSNGIVHDTVDLLSFKGPLPQRLMSGRSNFPIKIRGAVGTILGDASLPHVCGGEDKDRNELRECWAFNSYRNTWSVSGQMGETRSYSVSDTHPSHGWVIAGGDGDGFGYGGSKSSAERTKDGTTFLPFTALPLALKEHGLVSLGVGGKGDFFLTGGRTTGKRYNKNSFIYTSGSWRKVADMPTARHGKKCAAILILDLRKLRKIKTEWK